MSAAYFPLIIFQSKVGNRPFRAIYLSLRSSHWGLVSFAVTLKLIRFVLFSESLSTFGNLISPDMSSSLWVVCQQLSCITAEKV